LLMDAEKTGFQANVLTNKLFSIAGGGSPVMTECDIKQIISNSAGFVISNDAIEYRIRYGNDLPLILADSGMIDSAFENILKNAVEALPDGGKIMVCADNVHIDSSMPLPLADGEYIRVSVSDTGAGIPLGNKAKVFDPFFTTRPNGQGLGLPLAYAAVRQHGGHITLDSDNSGTTVSMYLPCPGRTSTEKPEKGYGKGTILFMDDEELLRNSATNVLSFLGFNVKTVGNGDEAVIAFREALSSDKPFDIVVLDLIINNGRGGKEIIGEILSMDRNACVVISSGYVNDPVLRDFKKYGFSGAITKPYTIADLNATLSNLSRRYAIPG
jgi:two-component system, cell cycle sensor histidine kinase and response regulator CckA